MIFLSPKYAQRLFDRVQFIPSFITMSKPRVYVTRCDYHPETIAQITQNPEIEADVSQREGGATREEFLKKIKGRNCTISLKYLFYLVSRRLWRSDHARQGRDGQGGHPGGRGQPQGRQHAQRGVRLIRNTTIRTRPFQYTD